MPEQADQMKVEEIVDRPVFRGFRCMIIEHGKSDEAFRIQQEAAEDMRINGPLSEEKERKYLERHRAVSWGLCCGAFAAKG